MRKILLLAVFATTLGVPAAQAEDISKEISLSPKDPKYNSAACRSMREQARNYAGITQQSPEAYVFAAVAPGGTLGFLAFNHRKREMFKARVEQACMTNPPDRSYLDPSGPQKKK